MPLAEVVTIEVGAAIAKYILKLWLKDASLGSDISSSVIDLLKKKTSDKLAQRKGNRQFEIIGEKVGEDLLPYFESEGISLDEGERTAVAYSIAETFNQSTLSSELLVQYNLDPRRLAQAILVDYRLATLGFNEAATELYRRIIYEACHAITEIASQLPSFTENSIAEILKRQDQLLNKTEQILHEIRRMREQTDPLSEAAQFELAYRRSVLRNLDYLELFGVDVSLASRRHRLSVAYVTLSVKHGFLKPPNNGTDTTTDSNISEPKDQSDRRLVSVDKALISSHRLLIYGLAGSGKTTLLQWIAVKSAQQAFDKILEDWNNTVPFYIRLRQHVQSELPKPENFPELITPSIAGTMPREWVHHQLTNGRAIILIDGLDEVPIARRKDVQVWLKDLMSNYSQARFIITSRPHAIDRNWVEQESFNDAELQPMELTDIYKFIDHWHQAVSEELLDEKEKTKLTQYAKRLKEEVERSRPKRNLATSPLLCAMLCALNRDRRQELPSDRIELYEACCYMLLERRDKERGVDQTDYPNLTYRQKRALLEDFAYWMARNGWTEVTQKAADKRFTMILKNMPGVSQENSGIDIRKLFVERTGMLRELGTDQIDFAHRTFQEFLATKAILDEGDIGLLIKNAHNDQWRDIIMLVTGLAPQAICEQIIHELITQGDMKKGEHQYKLHLLAVSCLETAIKLGAEVRKEVAERLKELVPPNDMSDAQSLASAGELAVPYLHNSKAFSASTASACIYTLRLIGTESAMKMLEEYAKDTRPALIDELIRAWDYFDRDTYARRILMHALKDRREMVLEYMPSLIGLQYFTQLNKLILSRSDHIRDLGPITDLIQLNELELTNFKQVDDLSPLENLTRLTSLNLSYSLNIADLHPLSSLTDIKDLNLSFCLKITDLSPLINLTNLRILNLSFTRITDLSPLSNLTELRELDLSECWGIKSIDALTGLRNLETLKLRKISRQVPIPKNIREHVTLHSY